MGCHPHIYVLFSIYSIYGVFLNRNGINPVVGLSERPESFINEILNPKVLPHACQSLIQYTMIHPIYTQYTPNNAVLHTIYNNTFKIHPSVQTLSWCFFLCCACNFSEGKVTVLCNLRGFSDMFQLFTLVYYIMKHVFQPHMGQGLDKTYVGHKWGVGGMHGACQFCQAGWRGIKRAIGLTGSPGGEHQTRRAIPNLPHLPDTSRGGRYGTFSKKWIFSLNE